MNEPRKKWDCDCWVHYPNEAHKLKNGKWKCVDRYECIRDLIEPFAGGYNKKTHCRRKTDANGQKTLSSELERDSVQD